MALFGSFLILLLVATLLLAVLAQIPYPALKMPFPIFAKTNALKVYIALGGQVVSDNAAIAHRSCHLYCRRVKLADGIPFGACDTTADNLGCVTIALPPYYWLTDDKHSEKLSAFV
jgi:hypothetical protein